MFVNPPCLRWVRLLDILAASSRFAGMVYYRDYSATMLIGIPSIVLEKLHFCAGPFASSNYHPLPLQKSGGALPLWNDLPLLPRVANALVFFSYVRYLGVHFLGLPKLTSYSPPTPEYWPDNFVIHLRFNPGID